jgi:hypothetical protein
VAARSKAWVCGLSPAEIVGSNLAGVMNVFLLRLLCFFSYFCVGILNDPVNKSEYIVSNGKMADLGGRVI